MSKKLIVEEERFYLALQDGRADDKEYTSRKEANKALKEIPKDARRGTYIASYLKRTTL